MNKINFEVFCEQCGQRVQLSKSICPNCKAKLGDLECPNCKYVGVISGFENGCPKCSYSPFEELKETPFKRKHKMRINGFWNDNIFLKTRFDFGFNVNVMLYLFASFLIVLFLIYILFF